MAKKAKAEPIVEEAPKIMGYQERMEYQKKVERIDGEMKQMRYRDLQIACISRGMDFTQMVSGDIGKLHSWLIKNWDNPIDNEKLHEFDQWRADYLKGMGMEGEPFVRLGFVGEYNEETNDIEIKKPEKLKKTVEKRERDADTNIFLGTKKALTFQCLKEGKSIEETIKIVIAKFPEAKDKSIKLWYKRGKSIVKVEEPIKKEVKKKPTKKSK